jgi:hypothetical protein
LLQRRHPAVQTGAFGRLLVVALKAEQGRPQHHRADDGHDMIGLAPLILNTGGDRRPAGDVGRFFADLRSGEAAVRDRRDLRRRDLVS